MKSDEAGVYIGQSTTGRVVWNGCFAVNQRPGSTFPLEGLAAVALLFRFVAAIAWPQFTAKFSDAFNVTRPAAACGRSIAGREKQKEGERYAEHLSDLSWRKTLVICDVSETYVGQRLYSTRELSNTAAERLSALDNSDDPE